jgi:hypothetical protein
MNVLPILLAVGILVAPAVSRAQTPHLAALHTPFGHIPLARSGEL